MAKAKVEIGMKINKLIWFFSDILLLSQTDSSRDPWVDVHSWLHDLKSVSPKTPIYLSELSFKFVGFSPIKFCYMCMYVCNKYV